MSLGYFTNVFPNKTYQLKSEKCSGGKLSKGRTTGNKLPIFAIGKG